ncbi:MAG TPA: DUF4388 domain-containing protein [Acidimicrobiales bacterium]|nr:DUF4388 domain-containing protein [Acidimicrobiales bacterium]
MSLEGTLETIALPDVLALLSVTAKTGELRIESGGGVGSVWFDAGKVCGFDVGNNKTPVDALFALLRLREGKFKFHTGTQAVNAMGPDDVAPVLEEAENRLMQWPSIAAIVPSLSSRVVLKPTVEGTVMLRPEQWQLVAAVGSGRSVAEVISVQNLGEFDGSRAIKDLVDLRLVDVVAGQAPAAAASSLSAPGARPAAGPTTATVTKMAAAPDLAAGTGVDDGWEELPDDGSEVADLSEVWDDEAGDVGHAPDGEEEVDPSQDPVNRGLLLKFLGSARN